MMTMRFNAQKILPEITRPLGLNQTPISPFLSRSRSLRQFNMNELVTRIYSTIKLTNDKPKHPIKIQSVSSGFFTHQQCFSQFRVRDLQADGHHLQFEIEQEIQDSHCFKACWRTEETVKNVEDPENLEVFLLNGNSPDAQKIVVDRGCKWDLTRLFYSVMELNLKALAKDVLEKAKEPHKFSEVKFKLLPQCPVIIRKYMGSPKDHALNPSLPFVLMESYETKAVATMNFSDLMSLNNNSESEKFRIVSGLDFSDRVFQIIKELGTVPKLKILL